MSDGQRGSRSDGSCCRKRAGTGPSCREQPVQTCRWPWRDGGQCVWESASRGFGEQRGESRPSAGASAASWQAGAGSSRGKALLPGWALGLLRFGRGAERTPCGWSSTSGKAEQPPKAVLVAGMAGCPHPHGNLPLCLYRAWKQPWDRQGRKHPALQTDISIFTN